VGLEDSFNGVRSCKASGLYTIMVPDIIQPDEEMKGLADIILPSLKDVQAFLNLK
jgi:beta-phosphoglucomutase-like phosphatase (HAD superfamily)